MAPRGVSSAGPDCVRFSETMRGWLSPQVRCSHEEAERAGRAAGASGLFMLAIVTPDVDAMVADPHHRNRAFGCVFLPTLHAMPMTVERGHLDLFVDAAPAGAPPSRVLHMGYGLWLRDESGGRWYLRGIKEVVRRRWWPTVPADTVTLFTDVFAGDAPVGVPVLRGILREGVVGVLGQALSFRGEGRWFGLRGLFGFVRYYVRRAAGVYAGARTPAPRAEWSRVA